MRGRFQYDVYSSDWDVDADSDDDSARSYVRRAFLGVQGRLSENWRYKVDFVLNPGANGATTDADEEEVAVDDAFIEYVSDNWSIVIGEHNITSPLEDRISSLDIPFNERSSVVNAFGYGRLAGVGFIAGGANWSASTAFQGESLNSRETYAEDESTALSGRFTFAPIFETAPEGVTLVHLGLSARARDTGANADNRYRPRPLNGRNDRWVETAAVGDTDTTLGAELALQYGPFGAQAEYMMLEGENAAGVGFDASGYYVDVYWSLTGESRNYRGNQGSFGAIAPRNPVTNEGGWGHWMLSGRYDYIDLSDALFGGSRGEQTSYGVGLDWVPLDHVRFKLNYAVSDMDRVTGVDDEAQIVSLRTQFDF
jgi:phosphate-selective porin OprO/OprP